MVADMENEPNNERKAKIFVSYSRKDMTFTHRIEAALKARSFEVLIDRQEIYAFEDWWKRIQALISQSDTVVFILSPDAVKSDVAMREVTYAASLNKRFAPIVCRPVENGAIPEPLRRLNFVFFDNEERFEESAEQLGAALQTDIVWIRDHTKFGEAARAWAAAGRPNGLLLRTPALEMAEYWIASRPREAPKPPEEVRAYVALSRQAARTTQRLRRVVIASMFTLLLGVILGLVGWINQDYIKQQWRWYVTIRPFMQARVRPYVLSLEAERALKPLESFKECAADVSCPEMVVIPPGKFMMGSPTGKNAKLGAHEIGEIASEGPQHEVVFVVPFAVSRFEITSDQWDLCIADGDCVGRVGNNTWGGGLQPAIEVSWADAQRYVTWFSRMTGKVYRLLSEAEWEYAARAGTHTVYSFGDDPAVLGDYAWYVSNSELQTHPIGQKKASPWGLYDIHGNVREWVEDCFHDDYNGAPADGSAWTAGDCSLHMIRGGSWRGVAETLTSAHRIGSATEVRNGGTGMRIARTLSATVSKTAAPGGR